MTNKDNRAIPRKTDAHTDHEQDMVNAYLDCLLNANNLNPDQHLQQLAVHLGRILHEPIFVTLMEFARVKAQYPQNLLPPVAQQTMDSLLEFFTLYGRRDARGALEQVQL